jgi:hypothetical protein
MASNKVLVEVERFGFSDNPTFDTLLNKLAQLAGKWRTDKQAELVEQYQTILRSLIMLGFHEELPVELELPDELMPEEYLSQF